MVDAVSEALGGGGGEGGGSTPSPTPSPTPTPSPAPTPTPSPAPAPTPTPSPTPTPTPTPSGVRWQDVLLPEDMRTNDSLANFKDVATLGKAFVEQQKWARGRVAVPALDDPEFDKKFGEFAGAMRPEKAEDYEIAVPEGGAAEFAEAARAKFHEIGLHPHQAKALAEWNNQFNSDQQSKLTRESQNEIMAIQLDIGDAAFNQRVEAVNNMLRNAGVDAVDIGVGLTQTLGAGATMKALFTLAEKTGELEKVDGALVAMRMGNMSPADAEAEIDRMDADPEIREKVRDKGSAEYAKRKRLFDLMNKSG